MSPSKAATRAVHIRRAEEYDVPAIVAMLADDPLGATREAATAEHSYYEAFRRIDGDENQRLLVAEIDEEVVGTLQISYLTSLSRGGAIRAQIEAVRVARSARGKGVGEVMLRWAIAEAIAYGAALVQLTSDQSRTEAHRFYERLGFQPTHLGFKLELPPR